MNKQEFTNYIADNFECSKASAEAIVTLFSESIYLAISEGYEVNIENFGKFSTKHLKSHHTPYSTPAKALKIGCMA